ncbi:alpha/beta hydrolase fold domain-containing protein [Staphylococcus succinus]|uniref:alpha/beta hydrolase fold domain-containing protein n=1 Tax=Staphylococcus succinus TaxID=61015 RepID=UPI003F5B2B26
MVVKKMIALTSALLTTSYLYIKIKEKRSYKSFLCEMMLRVNRVKRAFLTIEGAQRALNEVEQDTKGLYQGTQYQFQNNVEKTFYQNVTTYVVNDKSQNQQAVILYLHGGAWFQNPLDHHFSYIDMLANHFDAKVIMPIYPKVPHATYQDTFDLLVEIYDELSEMIQPGKQLTIMGDSAGGQIALSFAQLLKYKGLSQPQHIVLLSPVLDATFSNPEAQKYERIDPMLGIEGSKYFLKLWAGDLPLDNWEISPINGDLTGLGHITISVGTKETLYPDAVKLSDLLNKQNIVHEFLPGYNLFHIYQVFPIPERQQVLLKLKQIIKVD